MLNAYLNTPDNAERIGWGYPDMDDYWRGDSLAKFVVHDHLHGLFIFTDDLPANATLQEAA